MPKIKCPLENCDYETPDCSDVIVAALLTTHSSIHSHGNIKSAADKIKRPTITSDLSNEQWSYFVSRWDNYRKSTKISETEEVVQLLECLDEDLRMNLTRSIGDKINQKNSTELLKAIKTFAVREENLIIARIDLHNMKQEQDESIHTYAARLKGKASQCKLSSKCSSCNSEVDYSDSTITDAISRGLYDHDIQLQLITASYNQEMTLAQMINFIETREAGKRSAAKLNQNQSINATSNYKRQANKNMIDKKENTESCTFCGKKGHGKYSPLKLRENKCPAYGNVCKNCNKKNHFTELCKFKNSSEICEDEIYPGYENYMLQDTEETANSINTLSIDHYQYDKILNTWRKKPSAEQPFIKLKISTSTRDYNEIGYSLNTEEKSCIVPVMADTGCQSCLAGVKLLGKLNLKISDLIPVHMKMAAANAKPINILGAAILRYSGTDSNGNAIETRQITYITDNSEKVFLSKEACQDLGMISQSFPKVGESNNEMQSSEITLESCNCARRQMPPPPPTKLPVPATEKNKKYLKEFILDYYKSSTFNICSHQSLPMMKGPPMKLNIDTSAEPKAYHTPVPVPLHWQEEVKKGIDQDVNLGVIEPVPVGEPVTCCHRMVLCPKKNGKPRRTVDLQALNAYATRETHHTQSPFHQARSVPANMKKTIFDAWNGYHSVPIREEDRHLTTFITPWGRYRYCVAPQGYIASGDAYSRRYDEIVSDIPNKSKCIDDTILWSYNIEKSFFQTVKWLDICGKNGIILNPEKIVFAEDSVEFAGFQITKQTVQPAEKYFQAIKDFPCPKI